MGGSSASGGDNNQVSGYEAEITKQRRQQSNAINTDQKVGTYGDTKTGRTFGGEYSKENQNPNDNIQTKKNTTTYDGGGGDGQQNNNTIVNKTVGGTKIQTTEAKVEKAADLTAEQILLKNKKKGRSMTMMSGAKGVTKTSSDYSLGKKSLLGIV